MTLTMQISRREDAKGSAASVDTSASSSKNLVIRKDLLTPESQRNLSNDLLGLDVTTPLRCVNGLYTSWVSGKC